MKINFFPFLKKKDNTKNSATKTPSAGDRYQEKIQKENLSKLNERIDAHVKKFARNHRTVITESDFNVLHDATKRIASDEISCFLYRPDTKEMHLYFQQNGLCLRRKNAFFMITSITCFPLGQARICYRTKDKNHHTIEREETI